MTAMLKKHRDWWMPESEDLGLKWFNNPRGERPEVIDAAMGHVTNAPDKIALDVGAHIGTWAIELAKHFKHTHCFEPITPTWIALAHNLEARDISPEVVTPWPIAVGDRLSNCRPTGTMNATLSSYVDPEMRGRVPMIALDDIEWGKVGLLKIDVEGYEYYVLKGAERTLENYHPVLVIEWKPGRLNRFGDFETKIEAILNRHGYRMAEQLEIDRIYV